LKLIKAFLIALINRFVDSPVGNGGAFLCSDSISLSFPKIPGEFLFNKLNFSGDLEAV
jgi:hypothetical protein